MNVPPRSFDWANAAWAQSYEARTAVLIIACHVASGTSSTLCGSPTGATRIVDEAVQAPEAIDGGVDGRRHVGGHGDVTPQRRTRCRPGG